MYIDEMIARVQGTTFTYALHDANFNVTAIVDSTGTVLERYAYTPYGEVSFYAANFTARTASAYAWQYLYTGRRLDAETGLMYYRNRYYDTDLGRFISRDPMGYAAGDMNLYGYVGGNPAGFVDPLGTKVFWAARDLDGVCLGNHHTMVVVPDKPSDFPGQLNDLYGGEQGFTMSAFNNNGSLVYGKDNAADIAAMRELNDPERYGKSSEKYKSGWSTVRHEVKTPKGMTDTQFIQRLVAAAKAYEENTKADPIAYDLYGQDWGCGDKSGNCASWVNTCFKKGGVSEKARIKAGEFPGIDYGEEEEIDNSYFEKKREKRNK